jgi:hypothetical protein
LWISTSFRISGRNYDSILKTTLGDIIIDDDKEIAKKRVQQITRMPEEQLENLQYMEHQKIVSRQIKLLEEVGIQYLIVDLDPSRELEALVIFVNNIIKKR